MVFTWYSPRVKSSLPSLYLVFTRVKWFLPGLYWVKTRANVTGRPKSPLEGPVGRRWGPKEVENRLFRPQLDVRPGSKPSASPTAVPTLSLNGW